MCARSHPSMSWVQVSSFELGKPFLWALLLPGLPCRVSDMLTTSFLLLTDNKFPNQWSMLLKWWWLIDCLSSFSLPDRISCIPGWLQIYYVTKDDLKCLILLSLPHPTSRCCNYRFIPLHLIWLSPNVFLRDMVSKPTMTLSFFS